MRVGMADQAHSNNDRTAGLLLMGAAALALALANSPLAGAYHGLLTTSVGPLTVAYWIADGLMALFFLLVGLEVKREWFDGQLSTPEQRRLPMIGAAGGMAVPALVYLLVTGGDRRLWPYLLLFPFLWVAVFQSGVHATIAGVLAALAIPLGRGEAVSPLKILEHRLHGIVMMGIVPLFGLAKAGVTLRPDALDGSLPWAVAAGLVVGKQVGVFGSLWAADRFRIATKPAALGWAHIYGAALLCGIGFTMSLFIGALAFEDAALIDAAKIGTLAGSAVAGIVGFLVLRLMPVQEAPLHDRDEAAEIFGEDAEEDPTVCNDPYSPPSSR
jgi:NhaA family Na+:H+ antiporter